MKKNKDDKVHCFTKCQIDDFFSLPFTFLYSQKIWVNGCMTEARQTLFKHVMPLLLICALVSLVVGLIELLLLLCAVCFADHIKVRSLHFHLKLQVGVGSKIWVGQKFTPNSDQALGSNLFWGQITVNL